MPDKHLTLSCALIESESAKATKELMQGRRNTLICMNPIPPKNQIVLTLHFRDEESYSKCLTSNGELHGSNSFGAKGLAPSNTTDRHVCLDQVLVLATELLVQRVGHKIYNSPTIY